MCPSEDELVALVSGKLTPAAVRQVHEHAETCPSCRQLLVQMAMAVDPEGPTARAPGAPAPDDGDASQDATDPLERPPTLVAGGRLGRYHILQLLGAGGMGAVYAAYDSVLDRRVALKLLRAPSARAHERLGMRLEREAQAMAKLAHPNVVAVHDVGSAGGQLFVAMEYVDGSTLRQWLRAEPRTWSQIRDMFVQAGRGLSAAHAAGLVHRDFKPDNVLIGLDGRARVADFGLARALEGGPPPPLPREEAPDSPIRVEMQITADGMLVGTPRYMAPEQLRGDVAGARADQFAFAVALYEALYGQRPFAPDEPFARLNAIELGQVREPRDARGAPEWVWAALRPALSNDPQLRHASMDVLLEALLQDAMRPRTGWRTAAAVVAGIAAVAGAAGWALRPDLRCQGAPALLEGTWDAPRRASVVAALGGQSERAERTAAALDGYAREWAAMHQEACTAARIRGDQTLATMELRMACLERRRKDLGYLVALLVEPDPALGAQAVDAALGLPAIRSCADTSALSDRAPLPADPAARAAIDALSEQLSEVNALRLAGRYPESLGRLVLLEAESARLGYRPLQAEVLFQRGLVLDRSGRQADAQRALVEASYAAEAGRDDALKTSIVGRLAMVSGRLGRFEEGEHWARVGRASLERGGGDPEAEGALLGNVASLRLEEGKTDEAVAAYERSARLLTAALGPDAPQTLNALSNLAAAHSRGEHPEQAVRLLEQAIPAIERLRGASHPALFVPLWNQGYSLMRLHRFPAAHAAAARALDLARRALGESHPRVGAALDLEGTILQEEGRFREALAAYREALAVKHKTPSVSGPELSHSYDGIGQSLLGLGHPAEAVEPLETALKLRGPEPEQRAETRFALARALWSNRKERARALELARQAQADFERARRPVKEAAVASWLRAEMARGP